MKQKLVQLLFIVLILSLTISCTNEETFNENPNIIFILTDDQRWDALGYAGIHYVDSSGRNDIITAKVSVEKGNINFYAETAGDLTPHTDKNWMLLLIDADKNSETGWYGYDFLINKNIIDSNTTELMKYNGSGDAEGSWEKIDEISYNYSGNQLELEIPREMIGLNTDEISFDFKWTDNPEELKDPVSLCLKGDTAPNRRFNYRFIWTR